MTYTYDIDTWYLVSEYTVLYTELYIIHFRNNVRCCKSLLRVGVMSIKVHFRRGNCLYTEFIYGLRFTLKAACGKKS